MFERAKLAVCRRLPARFWRWVIRRPDVCPSRAINLSVGWTAPEDMFDLTLREYLRPDESCFMGHPEPHDYCGRYASPEEHPCFAAVVAQREAERVREFPAERQRGSAP